MFVVVFFLGEIQTLNFNVYNINEIITENLEASHFA